MIRDYKHAKEVQGRRYKAGKLGIAKAVRRYLKRSGGAQFATYREAKESLPAKWPIWMEDGSAS